MARTTIREAMGACGGFQYSIYVQCRIDKHVVVAVAGFIDICMATAGGADGCRAWKTGRDGNASRMAGSGGRWKTMTLAAERGGQRCRTIGCTCPDRRPVTAAGIAARHGVAVTVRGGAALVCPGCGHGSRHGVWSVQGGRVCVGSCSKTAVESGDVAAVDGETYVDSVAGHWFAGKPVMAGFAVHHVIFGVGCVSAGIR